MQRRHEKTLLRVFEKYYKKRGGAAISTNPFKILVACLLSQRTREKNTEAAVKNLFAKAETPQEIAKIQIRKLQSLIRASGTYRQKAARIKKVCKILIEQYGGKVPKTREELMELPGIGYKCADIVLMSGFGIPAIAVDVHVYVVSKRLGIAPPAANIEEVKADLEKFFPKQKWKFINLGMVNFGREICQTRKPLCILSADNCPFSSFCRAYRTKRFGVK